MVFKTECPGSAVSYLDYQTFAIDAATGGLQEEDNHEEIVPPLIWSFLYLKREYNILQDPSEGDTATQFIIRAQDEAICSNRSSVGDQRQFEDLIPNARFSYYRVYMMGEGEHRSIRLS